MNDTNTTMEERFDERFKENLYSTSGNKYLRVGGQLWNAQDLLSFIAEERRLAQREVLKDVLSNEGRIFDILNCYEIDARNIENGITYIDSSEAQRLAKRILKSIEDNSGISLTEEDNK